MKRSFIIFFIIAILGTSLNAVEPKTITFQELQKNKGAWEDPITIRGFLVKDTNGDWNLMDKPNIKSCCVYKEPVRIIVEGDIPENPSTTTAVTLQGFIHHRDNNTFILTSVKKM